MTSSVTDEFNDDFDLSDLGLTNGKKQEDLSSTDDHLHGEPADSTAQPDSPDEEIVDLALVGEFLGVASDPFPEEVREPDQDVLDTLAEEDASLVRLSPTDFLPEKSDPSDATIVTNHESKKDDALLFYFDNVDLEVNDEDMKPHDKKTRRLREGIRNPESPGGRKRADTTLSLEMELEKALHFLSEDDEPLPTTKKPSPREMYLEDSEGSLDSLEKDALKSEAGEKSSSIEMDSEESLDFLDELEEEDLLLPEEMELEEPFDFLEGLEEEDLRLSEEMELEESFDFLEELGKKITSDPHRETGGFYPVSEGEEILDINDILAAPVLPREFRTPNEKSDMEMDLEEFSDFLEEAADSSASSASLVDSEPDRPGKKITQDSQREAGGFYPVSEGEEILDIDDILKASVLPHQMFQAPGGESGMFGDRVVSADSFAAEGVLDIDDLIMDVSPPARAVMEEKEEKPGTEDPDLPGEEVDPSLEGLFGEESGVMEFPFEKTSPENLGTAEKTSGEKNDADLEFSDFDASLDSALSFLFDGEESLEKTDLPEEEKIPGSTTTESFEENLPAIPDEPDEFLMNFDLTEKSSMPEGVFAEIRIEDASVISPTEGEFDEPELLSLAAAHKRTEQESFPDSTPREESVSGAEDPDTLLDSIEKVDFEENAHRETLSGTDVETIDPGGALVIEDTTARDPEMLSEKDFLSDIGLEMAIEESGADKDLSTEDKFSENFEELSGRLEEFPGEAFLSESGMPEPEEAENRERVSAGDGIVESLEEDFISLSDLEMELDETGSDEEAVKEGRVSGDPGESFISLSELEMELDETGPDAEAASESRISGDFDEFSRDLEEFLEEEPLPESGMSEPEEAENGERIPAGDGIAEGPEEDSISFSDLEMELDEKGPDAEAASESRISGDLDELSRDLEEFLEEELLSESGIPEQEEAENGERIPAGDEIAESLEEDFISISDLEMELDETGPDAEAASEDRISGDLDEFSRDLEEFLEEKLLLSDSEPETLPEDSGAKAFEFTAEEALSPGRETSPDKAVGFANPDVLFDEKPASCADDESLARIVSRVSDEGNSGTVISRVLAPEDERVPSAVERDILLAVNPSISVSDLEGMLEKIVRKVLSEKIDAALVAAVEKAVEKEFRVLAHSLYDEES